MWGKVSRENGHVTRKFRIHLYSQINIKSGSSFVHHNRCIQLVSFFENSNVSNFQTAISIHSLSSEDFCLIRFVPIAGFKAYIGFIQLEVAHTHPVVVTFCHLLWKSIGKNKFTSAQLTSYKTFDIVEEGQLRGNRSGF